MIKLSGILEFSMGSFLCLRGYADYKTLSSISIENKDVQRELIEKHKGEMAAFLNSGEYRFFPEIVMSVSLLTENNYSDVEDFFTVIRNKEKWNKKLGDLEISVFNHDVGDKNRIAHITFDETKIKLNRIDGNHRLSAANDVRNDFKAPFCLILCQNPNEENCYSRAIFHNINAKQIPLNLEENLKVILEGTDVFGNEKLKNDPSFGWKYYLSRKVAQTIDFSAYPFIRALLRTNKYSYLLETFGMLLAHNILREEENSVAIFTDQLEHIESALRDAELHAVPKNIAVLGALSFYKLENADKYKSFICWIKANSITDALDIHMSDLIAIYDKVFENAPKSIFMSMQFSTETEDTYQTVKDVRDAIKQENGIEINLIKVDEHHDGYSDDIYGRIVDGIKKSSLVVADLSYGNHNVHHEIGLAQGMGKKVLLLYKKRDGVDAKQEIGSNISMYDQVRFINQTELRPILKDKIKQCFDIKDR